MELILVHMLLRKSLYSLIMMTMIIQVMAIHYNITLQKYDHEGLKNWHHNGMLKADYYCIIILHYFFSITR